MINAVTLPLLANRWTPFVQTFVIVGVDLSGATPRMQVRLKPDTPGTPLTDLTSAAPGVQGISISVDNSGPTPVSTIQSVIDESTMRAMPAEAELGDAAVFAWDLQVDRPGYFNAVWFRGSFTVEAGVTQDA